METPRERLERKAQKLDELKNRTPQKGVNFVLSNHAKQRMLERNVSTEEVLQALKGKVSRTDSRSAAPWVASLGTLRVFFDAVLLEVPVVTIMTVFHQV